MGEVRETSAVEADGAAADDLVAVSMVECCLGTKPIHAARLRPDENVFQISDLGYQQRTRRDF